jgi:hypothetical protein
MTLVKVDADTWIDPERVLYLVGDAAGTTKIVFTGTIERWVRAFAPAETVAARLRVPYSPDAI